MNAVTTRIQAEAFATALQIGAATVDEVVEWAIHVIQCETSPHWSFCELVTCRNLYPPDVAHLLRSVPGASDHAASQRIVIEMLHDSLEKAPARANQIASSLYSLAMEDKIANPNLKALAWWAWDALDLADSGLIAETREQIVAQMRTAFANARY